MKRPGVGESHAFARVLSMGRVREVFKEDELAFWQPKCLGARLVALLSIHTLLVLKHSDQIFSIVMETRSSVREQVAQPCRHPQSRYARCFISWHLNSATPPSNQGSAHTPFDDTEIPPESISSAIIFMARPEGPLQVCNSHRLALVAVFINCCGTTTMVLA
jgi:hypothetical protein